MRRRRSGASFQLQPFQKGRELIIGAISRHRLFRSWAGLCQSLLFQRQIRIQVDLGRVDRFVAQPESDH